MSAVWGIIPAAGVGSRIQPLAFSKELLPVGSRFEDGQERPRAVSEYLVERMIQANAKKLCFVIAPGKSDIVQYYGSRLWGAEIVYVVQPKPAGLCDAIFRALTVIGPEDEVLIGLPDTVWTPEDGFALLPPGVLSFLLFSVEHPHLFDAVITDESNNVQEILVKCAKVKTNWIWGAVRMPGSILAELHALWLQPERNDEYLGTLVSAWLAKGKAAQGIRAGRGYVDVGTLNGYRKAVALLATVEGEG